jgi:hypothetical protein
VVHAYNTNYLVLYLEEIPGPWFKAILGKKWDFVSRTSSE